MNLKRLGAAVFVLASLGSLLLLGLVLAHWERARRSEGTISSPQLQAVATRSNTSQTSTSVTSGGTEARLVGGDAMILDEGSGPFTSRLAHLLRSSLLESGVIQSVTVRRPADEKAEAILLNSPDGGPALFFRIADRDLEIGGMTTLRVKGFIDLSMGTAPWASDHSYQTNDTPPRLEFYWNSELQTDTEIQGVALDREDIAARELAKKLSEAVKKQLQEWQRKYDLMPELPAALYGQHRPSPQLELPAGLIAKPVISYSGLLSHNQTFWTFSREGLPGPLFQEIRQSLEGANWKLADFSDGDQPYLRATRGLSTIVVFPQRQAPLASDQEKTGIKRYVVQYDERFSADERAVAIDALFATNDAEALWVFERMMTDAQRARLAQLPAVTPQQYLQLGRLQRRWKDDQAALKALHRAAALLSVQMEDRGVTKDLENELKELTGSSKLPEITADLLREVGFVEIVAGAEPTVTEKRANEPAGFYYLQKNGKLRTFLIVVRPGSGAMDTALEFVSVSGGGKSQSIRGGTKGPNGKWRCDLSDSFDSVRMSGFAEEGETPGAYRVSARLVDDWAEPVGQ
jgi:hypothetical protein